MTPEYLAENVNKKYVYLSVSLQRLNHRWPGTLAVVNTSTNSSTFIGNLCWIYDWNIINVPVSIVLTAILPKKTTKTNKKIIRWEIVWPRCYPIWICYVNQPLWLELTGGSGRGLHIDKQLGQRSTLAKIWRQSYSKVLRSSRRSKLNNLCWSKWIWRFLDLACSRS